jgi:hypothetical protein
LSQISTPGKNLVCMIHLLQEFSVLFFAFGA